MAIKTSIYNQTGDNIGEIELSEKVFAVKVNESLVHQAMITQQANERQVLAHTKIRSEVRGGGKKPWRQKGTGRARAGSSRSPIWIGGGVTFGPRKDRNFSIKINRKMKQAALLMVLSDRLLNRNLAILDNIETAEFKTKIINNILHNFENKIFAPAVPDVKAAAPAEKKPAKKSGAKSPKPKPARRSILLINDKADEKIKFSARNLADVKLLNIDNLNILDLLRYRNFIITKEAAVKLADRYSK